MTTTETRTLTVLLLAGLLLLAAISPTVFVYGVVILAFLYMLGLCWHLYIERAKLWSQNVDLSAKVVGQESDLRKLEAALVDVRGRLHDAEILRVTFDNPPTTPNVVSISGARLTSVPKQREEDQ